MYQRKQKNFLSRFASPSAFDYADEDGAAMGDLDPAPMRPAALPDEVDPSEPLHLFDNMDFDERRVDLPCNDEGEVVLAPLRAETDPYHGREEDLAWFEYDDPADFQPLGEQPIIEIEPPGDELSETEFFEADLPEAGPCEIGLDEDRWLPDVDDMRDADPREIIESAIDLPSVATVRRRLGVEDGPPPADPPENRSSHADSSFIRASYGRGAPPEASEVPTVDHRLSEPEFPAPGPPVSQASQPVLQTSGQASRPAVSRWASAPARVKAFTQGLGRGLATAARAGLAALVLGLGRLTLSAAGGACSASRSVRRVAAASLVALKAIVALVRHVMSKGLQALRARLPFLIALIARTASEAKSALLAGLAVVATRSSIGVGRGLSLGRQAVSGSSAAMAGFAGTARPLTAAFLSRSATAGRGARDLAQRSIRARLKDGEPGPGGGIRASLDRMAALAARAGRPLRAIIAKAAPPERADDLRIAGVAGGVAVFLLLVTAWSHMSTSSAPSIVMAFPEKPSIRDLKASDAGSVIRSPKIAFARPRPEASEPPLSPEDALAKLIETSPQAEEPAPATRWIGPLPTVQ